MTGRIDKVILGKLEAFARRRHRLILFRGILSVVGILSGVMLLVATIDFSVPFLADWVRWGMSGVGYGLALWVGWRQIFRRILWAPDERQMARLIEQAEPKLREDLLSAVELGRGEGEVFDSEQFRELLQRDVASRMTGLEVKELLPVALIGRWVVVLAGIGVVVLGLSFVSENRLKTLLLRALIPGEDFENVGRMRLTVWEPEGGDKTVAQGDTVRVMVEVTGGEAQGAKMEVQSEGGGRVVEEMKVLGKNQFRSTLQIGRENVKYRMRCGDGQTRFYRLTAVARPAEIAFEKRYRLPEYTKMEKKTEKGARGDLAGLVGTEVELRIRANQVLRSGELRMDCGEKASVVKLRPEGDGRVFVGQFLLKESGTYRVHLEAAGTGFVNKFSPEYEVRVIADQAPVVEILEPGLDVVAPANEVIRLVGRATDDIGVARVVQMIRVNEGAWREVVLREGGGKEVRVERDWDLADEGVKLNDLVTTKWVATDFAGGRSESRALQVVILAATMEVKRLGGLEMRRTFVRALKELEGAGARLEKAALGVRLKFEEGEKGVGERKAILGGCARALAEYEAKLAESWVALSGPLLDARGNHESADLVMVGRLLNQANSGEVQVAGKELRLLYEKPEQAGGVEMAVEMERRVLRGRGMTSMAYEAGVFNLAGEEIDIVFELSMMLYADQRRWRGLAETGKVRTRMHSLIGVTRSLDGVLEGIKNGGSAIAGEGGAILGGDYFLGTRDAVEKTLKEGVKAEEMREVFQEFERGFGPVVWDSRTARSRLATAALGVITARGKLGVEPLASIHRMIMEELEPSWRSVERMREELGVIGKREGISDEVRQALREGRWGSTSDLFRGHADLEEMRAVADTGFLGDLRRASVATISVGALERGDGWEKTVERLEILEESLRVLESGHRLQELADGLDELMVEERWEVRRAHGRTVMPRTWTWLATRLRMTPEQWKSAGWKEGEAKEVFAGAALMLEAVVGGADYLAVGEEMGQRGKLSRIPETSQVVLGRVLGRVKAILGKLRPSINLARKNLAGLTPKISELAYALAREEAGVKKESNQWAGKAGVTKVEENRKGGEGQLGKQRGINGRIEMLKDLIRADASEQSLLKKDQRERMRDGDDALAMLKEPPGLVEQGLLEVTRGSEASQQEADWDLAIVEEQKLVDILNQIAGHYESLEKSEKVEESRTVLRDKEEALGVKDALDEEYKKAEKMAALAEMSLADQLAALEAQLPTHPAMQKELDQIARDALAVALVELERAAQAEKAAAERVDEAVLRDGDERYRRGAGELVGMTVGGLKEAMVGVEASRRVLDEEGNVKAVERLKVVGDRLGLALAEGERLGGAVERLGVAVGVEGTTAALTGVMQGVGMVVHLGTQAETEMKVVRGLAEVGGGKSGVEVEKIFGQLAGVIVAGNQASQAAQIFAVEVQALAKLPEGGVKNRRLALAAVEQTTVKGDTFEAAADVARAGRHETRLGKTEVGLKLSDLAGQISGAGYGEVSGAEKALGESVQLVAVQGPVRKAATRLAELVELLKEATKEANGAAPVTDPAEAGEEDDREKARDLDALDEEINPTDAIIPAPGNVEEPSKAGKIGGKAPLAASSMRQGRKGKPERMPGIPPPFMPVGKAEMGAKVAGGASGGVPPAVVGMKVGDWGKLPKKLAEQLSKGRNEELPGDYREAIEVYYRVVAERSKKP